MALDTYVRHYSELNPGHLSHGQPHYISTQERNYIQTVTHFGICCSFKRTSSQFTIFKIITNNNLHLSRINIVRSGFLHRKEITFKSLRILHTTFTQIFLFARPQNLMRDHQGLLPSSNWREKSSQTPLGIYAV